METSHVIEILKGIISENFEVEKVVSGFHVKIENSTKEICETVKFKILTHHSYNFQEVKIHRKYKYFHLYTRKVRFVHRKEKNPFQDYIYPHPRNY